MDYSINIEFLTQDATMEEAAAAAAKVGFTALDYTPAVRKDEWQEILDRDLETFARNGLRVNQTHAPFNRYGSCGDRHRLVLERAYEATKRSGAKYMVVHGDEFPFDQMEYTPERAEDYNYEYFAPYAERAAKDGVVLAFECLFQEPNRVDKPRHCQTAEQLKSLIERFGCDSVRCCWDFGHANVALGEAQAEKIAYLSPYIVCTHIHDNFGGIDMHYTPFYGKVDWKACMDALRAQPYPGTLNLELHRGIVPRPLLESRLRLECDTLKYLWGELK